jgi:putative peptidoglycan lipid II flippase
VLGPAALGAGVTQISLFFDTFIASWLPTGAVSYLYYADRLNQLPLGVIGIAIGTVLLPQLSRQLKSGDEAGARDSQNRAIEYTLVLTLPAVAAFIAVAYPVIEALFRRGAFTEADARATADVLRAYALGLPAFVLVRSLLPGFYAREDTRTPVRIAVAAVGANVALKLALVMPFGAMGLAIGTSVGAWVNCALLALVLSRRGHLAPDARLRRRLPRLGLAALGTAAALLAADALLRDFAAAGPWRSLAGLAGLMAVGGLAYGGFAVALGLLTRADLALFRRARRPGGAKP